MRTPTRVTSLTLAAEILLCLAVNGCQGSWDYTPPKVSWAELQGVWVDQDDASSYVIFDTRGSAMVCNFPSDYLSLVGISYDGEESVEFEAGYEIVDGVEVQVGARRDSAYSGALIDFGTSGDEGDVMLYAQSFGNPDSTDLRLFDKGDLSESERAEAGCPS